ncbi:hypothetical protein M5D96_000161 [Drosophila gunungcola]|uniref:Uncharacterized protein n=1 Tax=Drosophila gunungcola TaxID=103775 RepID=A0A9P9YVS5_9MUSC|nr:hypothetical protein M5D96_000161 [Drosophila gunungcola]
MPAAVTAFYNPEAMAAAIVLSTMSHASPRYDLLANGSVSVSAAQVGAPANTLPQVFVKPSLPQPSAADELMTTTAGAAHPPTQQLPTKFI